MKKKLFIIALIIIIVALAAMVGAVLARGRAVNQAEAKIAALTKPLNWDVQIDSGSVFSPTCLDSVRLAGPGQSHVTIQKVCITKGASTLLSDSPDFHVSMGQISGFVSEESIKALKNRQKSEKLAPGASAGLLNRANIVVNASRIDIQMGSKGRQIDVHSPSAIAHLNHGEWSGQFSFTPGIDLQKVPFAIQNLPLVTVNAQYSRQTQSGGCTVTFLPALQIASSAKETLVEAQIGAVTANIDKSAWDLSGSQISVTMPNDEVQSKFTVEQISASFDQGMPSKEGLKKVLLVSPNLEVPLDNLLKAKFITDNAMLSGLIRFWQQDAGAFLGEAPKDSVRRADVKKNKAVVKKNPIPKETILKVRNTFSKLQQKIQSLPAIEIQDGQLGLQSGDDVFSLQGISLNTADLFKNSQQFDVGFNIRDARVDFDIAWPDESPIPDVALKIDRLSSQDFLHIINLPVPEKNDGTVTMDMHISGTDEDFSLNGNIEFNDFAFYHPKISPNLVHDIQAKASIDASYHFNTDKLTIKPMSFTLGPITAEGFMTVTNVRSNPIIDFELGAKDIKCTDIPKAIPKGLFPTLTNLEMAGTTMSPKIWGNIPWKSPLTSTLKASGFENRCIPTSVLPHRPEGLDDPNYTFTTPYTYFTDSITVGPGVPEYTPLEKIPPYVKAAMYLTEDKRFFEHGPVRIAFIERALRLNLNQRSYVYGGSTIGQQLTKNLFLNRNKNLARKLEEAFITWHMVTHVPRTKLFELYINVIEFGPDVYGITNAAKFYFDKKPEDLTPLEGAYLASLKIAPSKGGKYYRFGYTKDGRWWNKRLKGIMKTLAENGYISAPEILAAHDWTPQFYYPKQAGDYRRIWMNNYDEYLKQKARQHREEKKRAK